MTAGRALLAVALLAVTAWGLLLAGLVWVGSRQGPLADRQLNLQAVATATGHSATATPATPTRRSGPLGNAGGSTAAAPTADPNLAAPTPRTTQSRAVTATPGAPAAEPSLPAAVDWPVTPDLTARRPLAESPQFRVFAAADDDALLVRRATEWSSRLGAILAADRQRLEGRDLPDRVNVVFARRYVARCPARGLAATHDDPPLLMVFIDEASSAVQIEAVLAHEIAHHLTLDDRFVGDGVLTEGIANWGGGQAVLRWQGFSDWPDAVRGYWRQGRYVPITDASALQPRGADDCIARRDRVYNIRTAFVGWLIARIGLARVLAMPAATVTWTDPASGERRQQILPDYELATGSSLGQLERQFLRSLGLGGPEVVMFQLRLELQGVDVQ